MAPSPHTPPAVGIVVRPETHSAWIRLVGDIDMAAQPALTEAAAQLHGRTPRLIVIDLTAATFVCSTLANYLATLHRAHPDAELVLHDPASIARVLIMVTGLDAIVVMSDDPATAPCLTPATPPLNTRYPGREAGTRRSEPGCWEAIDQQPGQGLNRR